jgi:hypothetical protein
VCGQYVADPLGMGGNVNAFIGKIISAVLGVTGSLALVMFIYGGLVWMTAAGASEKITKGKDILLWATIASSSFFTHTIVSSSSEQCWAHTY